MKEAHALLHSAGTPLLILTGQLQHYQKRTTSCETNAGSMKCRDMADAAR